MFRIIIGWLVTGLIVATVLVSLAYLRDMRRAYARVRGAGSVISSPYGQIEYAAGGSGPVVLLIHGSGGGYDQGELMARAVLGGQYHWIAPSRFGYLRSACPEGATFDDQARAYIYLLDKLGIGKVAVVALSHGGPSALLLAALHPDRVSSLTLISCGVASIATPVQSQANEKGNRLVGIFKHDVLYWTFTKIFRQQFLSLMGANDAVIAGLTGEQRIFIEQVVDHMNPVSPRAAGVAFDNKAAMPNARIAAVRAPTLIIHATDDTLQLHHNAVFAAATIPGAKLVSFDRGGHLLFGVEQAAIHAMVTRHILDHGNQ